MIDLHTHSTVSDGSDPPAAVVALAAEAGCTAMALTDHDRLDGVDEARRRGAEAGVEVVSGCELSCETPTGSLHLLAYFVEADDGPLAPELTRLQRARHERNRRLAARMEELGLPVTLAEMEEQAGGAAGAPAPATGKGVGRPHAAAVLVAKGVVGSIQEAFDRFLARGRPAYVERQRLTVPDAIRLVRDSAGVPVLAHPLTLDLAPEALEPAIEELAVLGLGGVETEYGRYPPAERRRLGDVAGRLGLVATGGSDYHGTFKPDLRVGVGRGDLCVADEVLAALTDRRP